MKDIKGKDREENYTIRELYTSQDADDKYDQKGTVFKHPFRAVINGPSGSGKTTVAGNITLDHCAFDTLTIYASNPDQEIFANLKAHIEKKVKEIKGDIDDYFHISNEIDRDPSDYDKDLQHLVIIDDMVSQDDKKNGNKAGAFFRRGRPNNISVIAIVQRLYNVNQDVRSNFNYYIEFGGTLPKDKLEVMKYVVGGDMERGLFDSIYHRATTKQFQGDKNAFFSAINFRDEVDKGLKYRRSFVPYSLFPREKSSEEKYKIKSNPKDTRLSSQQKTQYRSAPQTKRFVTSSDEYDSDDSDSD